MGGADAAFENMSDSLCDRISRTELIRNMTVFSTDNSTVNYAANSELV